MMFTKEYLMELTLMRAVAIELMELKVNLSGWTTGLNEYEGISKVITTVCQKRKKRVSDHRARKFTSVLVEGNRQP